MFKLIIESLDKWYEGALRAGGYWVIALMMTIESSVFPLPSELVIPPAAYKAYHGKLPLSLVGIVIAGTLGSWLGATLMYWAARLGGRPLFVRFGRYVLVSPQKLEGAERWASHYGSMGVFISRLLPVVRHLIGIPAGIVRMNYKVFSLYTLLGSAIWCSVLCYIGVKVGENPDIHKLTLWLAIAMLALGALYYFFVHRHMKAGPEPKVQSPKSEAPAPEPKGPTSGFGS